MTGPVRVGTKGGSTSAQKEKAMRIPITVALTAALLATAPAFSPRGGAFAQAVEPAGHRYVVAVSGMH